MTNEKRAVFKFLQNSYQRIVHQIYNPNLAKFDREKIVKLEQFLKYCLALNWNEKTVFALFHRVYRHVFFGSGFELLVDLSNRS